MYMSGIRKTIALFLIIFVGIPVLLGIIWSVGVTRAVVSHEFMSELPREIIERVPDMVDEIVEAVEREDVIADEEERIWFKAISEVKTTPRELMEKIGFLPWLKNELSQSLEDIGKVLRGEIPPRPIMLNMRPLKEALKHEGIDRYIEEILHKLPTCTPEQTEEWFESRYYGDTWWDELPPCVPTDIDRAVKVMRDVMLKEIDEIPDEVNILKLERKFYFRDSTIDITKLVVSLTFLLFLIPALILGLSALIATSSGDSMLRWIGYPVLIGGALSFGLSKFAEGAMQWGVDLMPFSYTYSMSHFEEFILEKTSDIALLVMERLFSAVNSVSGIVCIIGVILIALSYSVAQGQRPVNRQRAPQTTQPSQSHTPRQEQQHPTESTNRKDTGTDPQMKEE
jgi:hypothetical protein